MVTLARPPRSESAPIFHLNRSSHGPASHLRDRRVGGGGALDILCIPCRCIHRTYEGFSRTDKILSWLTLILLTANVLMVGPPYGNRDAEDKDPPIAKVRKNLRAAKDKWDQMFIPPTPAPTMAPTEAKVSETPEEIATKIAAEDWGVPKFKRPTKCTSDMISKIKKSGMDGSKCKGKPFGQECSHSVQTKTADNTWIEGFMDEVKEMRKDGKGSGSQKATFVAAIFSNKQNDCAKLSKFLRGPKKAPEELTKSPWLWCSEPYESPETKKWGKVGGGCTGSNMDEKMASRDLREAIKDAVLAGAGDESANMFKGGMNTLARTRYVEFSYDWKGAWESQSLKDVIIKMDKAGHACYWAGKGKLWRITSCWQGHYDFKSWSHVACANRVLAPKLAERMEGLFKKTIGVG